MTHGPGDSGGRDGEQPRLASRGWWSWPRCRTREPAAVTLHPVSLTFSDAALEAEYVLSRRSHRKASQRVWLLVNLLQLGAYVLFLPRSNVVAVLPILLLRISSVVLGGRLWPEWLPHRLNQLLQLPQNVIVAWVVADAACALPGPAPHRLYIATWPLLGRLPFAGFHDHFVVMAAVQLVVVLMHIAGIDYTVCSHTFMPGGPTPRGAEARSWAAQLLGVPAAALGAAMTWAMGSGPPGACGMHGGGAAAAPVSSFAVFRPTVDWWWSALDNATRAMSPHGCLCSPRHRALVSEGPEAGFARCMHLLAFGHVVAGGLLPLVLAHTSERRVRTSFLAGRAGAPGGQDAATAVTGGSSADDPGAAVPGGVSSRRVLLAGPAAGGGAAGSSWLGSLGRDGGGDPDPVMAALLTAPLVVMGLSLVWGLVGLSTLLWVLWW